MTIPNQYTGPKDSFSRKILDRIAKILARLEKENDWKRVETARKLDESMTFRIMKVGMKATHLKFEGIRSKLNRIASGTSCGLDGFLSLVGVSQGWDEEDALELLDVISKWSGADLKNFLQSYSESKISVDPLSNQKTMGQK